MKIENISIFGAILLNGKEYQDNDILQLIDQDITGWDWAGDQFEGESDICICDSDSPKTFDDLEEAISFLKSI